jgi:hypothetical protein
MEVGVWAAGVPALERRKFCHFAQQQLSAFFSLFCEAAAVLIVDVLLPILFASKRVLALLTNVQKRKNSR